MSKNKKTINITQKIKKIEIAKQVENNFDLIERPESLTGKTYKLKTPVLKRSLYITINNIKLKNGKIFPFEMFINTKNIESYSWMQALTVVISALFRQSSTHPNLLKLDFLIYQLKTICDPQEVYFSKGKQMSSVVAEVGYLVENHLIDLGLIKTNLISNPIKKNNDNKLFCSKCANYSIIKSENCETCLTCGDSKCG